jgi:hypothetical protein
MGLRQKLNENKPLSMAVAIAVVLIAGAILFWPSSGQMAFYTTDDGLTYFEHEQIPAPFSYKGKEALSAAVFRCGTEKPFVAYLTKFRDDAAKAAFEEARKTRSPFDDSLILFKKVGGTEWVARGPAANPAAAFARPPGGAAPAPAPAATADPVSALLQLKPCADGTRPRAYQAGVPH